ncbi:MAG TPA: hypothetical protein VFO62_10565 [Candidatus Binatia bacterium]|nr:hypothetical protein [Candidatus Binatia bacterium]
MNAYQVWDPSDADEGDARTISALSRSDAAHEFAERFDRDDWRNDETRVYCVRDHRGRLWAVAVTYSLQPVLRAHEPEPVDAPPAAPIGIAAGAVVEWIDANGERRRGKVYGVNPAGRVHVEEQMTNSSGRRRTKIVTHHFDAHETHRLTVTEGATAP